MSCRINAKRKWTARILLESFFHFESIFVTLTYNTEHLPITESGQATLKPEDFRLWMHRFRKAHAYISPVRFFGCGEYGKATEANGWIERPHYHAILFGVGLSAEYMVNESWALDNETIGFTSIGELNADRAAYVAAYTTKKMTQVGDKRLGDRHPEFARMSMRNGIGFPAVGWLANTMSSTNGLKNIAEYGDVWNSVRIDGKIWPLCLYLRRKLRIALGLPQDAQERAIHLDHVDPSTGEIIANKPLPEDYGPWQDYSLDKRLPLNHVRQKKTHLEAIPEVESKHAKDSRLKKAKTLTEGRI